jgi:predicted dehydrogenase
MDFALIGVGGFGGSVLSALKALEARGELRLAAVSDVQYERNRETIRELEASGARYYREYGEMLARETKAGAVAIATPIHLHREMAVRAMEAGFHVLLEKPPATTTQEVEAIGHPRGPGSSARSISRGPRTKPSWS